MSGRVLVVLVVVVLTLLLLLTVTEATVVLPQRPTYGPDLGNCTGSVKLVPVLQLVARDPTSPPPTSDTPPPPHTTTQPPHYPQPHGTTPPTAHPTTTQHPKQPTATLKSSLTHKKHTENGKLKGTLKKNDSEKNKHQLIFPESASFPSSSSYPTASPTPVPVPVPRPNLPPQTSTLPPPAATLPLPTAPPPPPPSTTTPKVRLSLQQAGEKLKRLLGKQIPLVLSSMLAKEFQRPYIQRIRAVNHELVDKVLQAEYQEYEPKPLHVNSSTCYLPGNRISHLYERRRLMLLLLQALPQSLEEVEEAATNPEITDYIFRPEKKAVFDVSGCRECYALDATGVCREVFFCKGGEDVFSMTSRRRRITG